MPRNQEAQAPDLSAIDSEISSTRASLDASIRSHSMRLAALMAQRQLALVGRYLAANPAAVLAEAAQDETTTRQGASPPPSEDGIESGTAKGPSPAAAPKSGRTATGKASRPKATDKGPDATKPGPGAAPPSPEPASRPGRKPAASKAAPATPVPSEAPAAAKPAKQPNALVQAAREALRASGKPMSALDIAKAIGVEPRKAAPYTAALLRTGFAVRSADGLFSAA